jgi:endonuclease-3
MAFNRLEQVIGITPDRIVQSSVDAIATNIKPAGMYRQRSDRIKKIAQEVIDRYQGDLSPILAKPYEEAKKELMSLPGVGPKTADVLLMFDGGMSVIPVDRHIFRISKRLELVPANAKYESVRSVLEIASPVDRYEDVHVLLIRFGREICIARNPKCKICFLNDVCPYPAKIE